MSRIDQIIEETIGREGRYSNNSDDAGGETMWGITATVARANGYLGAMKNLPRDMAVTIYHREYFVKPGLDKVLLRSSDIATEMFDTGVNMGQSIAVKFLQRALSLVGDRALVQDGQMGPGTLAALDAFMSKRGIEGELVLVRMLNCFQGARYAEITEQRPQNKTFIYGWFLNRVVV
ncbi:glycoside hydrolase family 108 protein [Pseudomonas mediterranea]|uniref:glycoside hydrolase family 108 protein n=1 Tax=Pseudomonas mediterranea TaxID=183795 RepID=UPI0006D8ACFF|nr:glycosyl hydrolase 108 family protein [Pseudomonas mediterranea]